MGTLESTPKDASHCSRLKMARAYRALTLDDRADLGAFDLKPHPRFPSISTCVSCVTTMTAR